MKTQHWVLLIIGLVVGLYLFKKYKMGQPTGNSTPLGGSL